MRTRKRYVWVAKHDANGCYVHDSGRWVDSAEWQPARTPRAPMVISDISPYISAVTGKQIGGRRQHRDHLRAHGMVEIGNERQEVRPIPLPPVVDDVHKAIAQLEAGDEPPAPERLREDYFPTVEIDPNA